MPFLTREFNEPLDPDEVIAKAVERLNKRPTFIDTSAARHVQSTASRLSLLFSFARQSAPSGAAGKPDERGELPEREMIQDAYASFSKD